MHTYETSDFYSKLRHEIRNQLTLMSGQLQLLASRYDFLNSDDIYLQLLKDIRSTYVILDNAALKYQSPRLLPCDIRALLQELYQSYLPVFQLKGKTFTLHIPDSLPAIRADAQLLHQALSNLIKNADEATSEGQQVYVHAYVKDQHLIISIRDNGVGMTPDQQAHIYEAYTSYKQGGTGLGLHMVKSIIYTHHGQLDCQSMPGQGSVFRIALPLSSPSV